jgi:signal transduction histidine kinase
VFVLMRPRRIPLAAEVALAFGAGVVVFALVSVTVVAVGSGVLAVIVGVACLVAVIAIARWSGIVYASPAAFATLIAFDWFSFPPTHAHGFPDTVDLAGLFSYLAVAVLVGELATYAGRSADVSEAARSELVKEQAALRRVATLVARGGPPEAIFAAVAEEVGILLEVDGARVLRHDGGDEVIQLPGWSASGSEPPPVGHADLVATPLTAEVLRTGRAARIEDYESVFDPLPPLLHQSGVRSAVGAPIVVDGRLWGVMLAWLVRPVPLPATTEARLANFTELIATAVSNSASREALARLAEEQAALRRVATLVASQPLPDHVFASVAEEVARVLRVDDTKLYRFEHDGTATVVADWGDPPTPAPVGAQLTLEAESIAGTVFKTARPARNDDYAGDARESATSARRHGFRSAVGCPILVDGRLWGAAVARSRQSVPPPADTESRMGEFTALLATAISNIEARSELAASRARIVAAADDERRRVVRDLHDGAQQRLVHTVITLKLARRALGKETGEGPELVTAALEQAMRANQELRELAHGIIPSILTMGGLRAGVEALATRAPVPVENGVAVGRLPAAVEATAYFVVAEALTNVAKHAHAARAAVTARVEDGMFRVEVRDDGVGGARPDGSGLVGLADRVAALDGRLRVESLAAGGTLVAAAIPLARR